MSKKGNATGNRQQTELWLYTEFEKIRASGKPIGITSFAKKLEINRSTIYQYPILAAEITEYAKKTQPKLSKRGAGAPLLEAHKRDATLKVRREYTKVVEENGRLRRQLLQSEQQKIVLMEENKQLKERLKRLSGAFVHLQQQAISHGLDPRLLNQQQNEFLSPNGSDVTER